MANVYGCGDNIYRPLVRNARDAREFEQLPNCHHGPDRKDHDLKGRHTLIARRFVYFGRDALRIPRHLDPTCQPGDLLTVRRRVIWRERRFKNPEKAVLEKNTGDVLNRF